MTFEVTLYSLGIMTKCCTDFRVIMIKMFLLITDLYAAVNTYVDTYSYLKSTLLLSPHLPGKFKNIPHCLTFKFKAELPTCKLTVVTFSRIGGSYVNKNVLWTSQSGGDIGWTTAHINIIEGYFDRFGFEGIKDQGENGDCFVAMDDMTVHDGNCV